MAKWRSKIGPISVELFGLQQVQELIKDMTKSQGKKIMRASLLAGARVIRNKARSRLPAQFKEAKRDIRIKNQKAKPTAPVRVKIGFAVKMTKVQQKAQHDKIHATRPKGRGVGISGANIHWAVLGTKERRHKSGKSVGAMPEVIPDFMSKAVASCRGQTYGAMLRAARKAVKKIEARHAVKAAKAAAMAAASNP